MNLKRRLSTRCRFYVASCRNRYQIITMGYKVCRQLHATWTRHGGSQFHSVFGDMLYGGNAHATCEVSAVYRTF